MPNLFTQFAHLGLGATATAEPAYDGLDWYDAYGDRHAADGAEGRLVALHSFSEDWQSWEIHPHGAELVVCTAGAITLHQELAGRIESIHLGPGDYAINPPGIWHTADIAGEATCLFVTPGMGTDHRPR